MFLTRLATTSNASRQVWKFSSRWYDRSSSRRLLFRQRSQSGRSSLTGRTILWTRKSLAKRIKLPKVTYSFRSREPGFITSFSLVPRSNKLLTLVLLASGAFAFFPATDSMSIFSPITLKTRANLLNPLFNAFHYTSILSAPLFRKVSNLELIPGSGAQYVRSAGCSAKITKIDRWSHTAVVKLPSGVRKVFSVYSFLVLGGCALKRKKVMRITKSGFWRSHGLKPKVRGVARNPVDHPHGGRTKSIKYPRTPWGKTTKFK